MGKTHIEIDEATRDELRVFKAKEGLTYDEAVTLLLETVDLEEHRQRMQDVATTLKEDAKRKRDFANEAKTNNEPEKYSTLSGQAKAFDAAAKRIENSINTEREAQANE